MDFVLRKLHTPFGTEQAQPARDRKDIAKGMGVYFLIWFVGFLFMPTFFIQNLQILLPSFVTMAIFLYFSLRLRLQVQDNVFGEIGFIYLALAVAYTVFPAYGFLTLDALSSGVGLENLATLAPGQAELGLHLWRHVLFIGAVGAGYLFFRGRRAPKFDSLKNLGPAEKPVIRFLFVTVVFSIIALWGLSAPVTTYLDNYTRYDDLSWIARRVVTICTVLKAGGTFVLLTAMFTNYKKYRLYIWFFVLLRVVYEVQNSFGARIDAFFILIAAAVLYHYSVKRVTLRRGLLLALAVGVVFSTIEIIRFVDLDPSVVEETVLQGRGMPAGELGAVFVTGFHLYSERSQRNLPPIEWQVFFNDFISMVPLVDQTRWNPMYWYAKNYFPSAVVPPATLGPIAESALWGGEIDLVIRGFINGVLFAFLMRWFARESGKWQIMTIYVFCYATCIMCLKYSIFYQLTPLVKIILPLLLIVSVLVRNIQRRAKLRGNSRYQRIAPGITPESLQTS
jgi:hypothetical protein